jgi:hypothetical protein
MLDGIARGDRSRSKGVGAGNFPSSVVRVNPGEIGSNDEDGLMMMVSTASNDPSAVV